MFYSPLTRFGWIDGVNALFDNVARAIVVCQQSVGAVNFQFLPYIVRLSRHAFGQKEIGMAMVGRA